MGKEKTGRLTRGAVLAIKARALMFAARPLFNSSKPYLDNGEHNDLICFGNENVSRWNDVITPMRLCSITGSNGYELITGGAGLGQPNPNALKDYGTATSTPSNNEVLLAYKINSTNQWNARKCNFLLSEYICQLDKQ